MSRAVSPLDRDAIVSLLVQAWRRHDAIHQELLDVIPRGGLAAVPTGSRGRDVARQFFHLNRVREGWLCFHATGKRPKLPRAVEGPPPTKAALKKALKASGREVERFVVRALDGEAKVRMFGGNVVRWVGYLVSHESHHRGQILLALKQSGVKLPKEFNVQGVWGAWISGK